MPKTMPTIPTKAKAHPTKAFFVRMLTRDISAHECALDLIDNSIDAAWAATGVAPGSLGVGRKLAKYRINLTVTKERFVISDNCGGMSLENAAQYAFTFGRDTLEGGNNYSVGVYGIGMKRAIFKLGTDIVVRSTYKGEQPFEVPINVGSWLAETSEVWDFNIKPSDPLPEPGVEISVPTLTSESAATFGDPGFPNALRAAIARDYMLPLMQGLTISVNDSQVEGWKIDFMEGADFAPMRDSYSDGEVSVEILAGMFEPPPDSNEPTRTRDDKSGWYVICNGRVVVAANRSPTTVWDRDRFPAWHAQYHGFIGVALLTSKRPELLPMTTTKSGVDTSLASYRRVQARMEAPTRAWIDYTNARKTRKEAARELERSAKPVHISDVKVRGALKVPAEIGEQSREANILYSKPIEQVRALGKALGRATMAYREVGSRAFDYAYARLVSEQ